MDRINDLLVFCPKCGKVIPLRFNLIPRESDYLIFDSGAEPKNGFQSSDETDRDQ